MLTTTESIEIYTDQMLEKTDSWNCHGFLAALSFTKNDVIANTPV